MGKLKHKEVAEKLVEHHGNMAAVGRALGCKRSSVRAFIVKHPDLLAICEDMHESMKDNAVTSLHRAVLAGESWAVCFFLKTQAKDRGYIEKQEFEHSGNIGGRLEVSEVVVTTRQEAAAILNLNIYHESPAQLPAAS
jgi:hypothetical protein